MNSSFENEVLKELVREVLQEVLSADGFGIASERLTLTQREAAQAIGVKSHVLRDLRLSGELRGSRVGKRIVYEVSELRDFLRRNSTDS